MDKSPHIRSADPAGTFDAAYYERFYRDPKTRVASPQYYRRIAAFISAYAEMLDLDIRRIADLGCGTGALRKPLRKQFGDARYVGVEKSPHACERYGWTPGCAASFRTAKRFDLVVCHDVLQYLDDELAAKAIKNFAKLTHSALYFSVLTREDWLHCVDQRRTDSNVHLRPASWYRPRLRRHFVNLGGGMYLAKKSDAVVYALEALD